MIWMDFSLHTFPLVGLPFRLEFNLAIRSVASISPFFGNYLLPNLVVDTRAGTNHEDKNPHYPLNINAIPGAGSIASLGLRLRWWGVVFSTGHSAFSN